MSLNKITPFVWFSATGGDIAKLVDYYKEIFADDFNADNIIPLGITPSGSTEMCHVAIYGQKYTFMHTEKADFPLNNAVSFVINCDNQSEIDKFWDFFAKDGQELECGWCIDKYGMRWQIIPNNFGELLHKPNGFAVMMNQKKIIISEY